MVGEQVGGRMGQVGIGGCSVFVYAVCMLCMTLTLSFYLFILSFVSSVLHAE